MITRYTDFWKLIKDIPTLKNTIIVVPESFKYEIRELSTRNYQSIMQIIKKNNIKVMEMKNDVKYNFKAK